MQLAGLGGGGRQINLANRTKSSLFKPQTDQVFSPFSVCSVFVSYAYLHPEGNTNAWCADSMVSNLSQRSPRQKVLFCPLNTYCQLIAACPGDVISISLKTNSSIENELTICNFLRFLNLQPDTKLTLNLIEYSFGGGTPVFIYQIAVAWRK
jgi:hypothetical protein